MSPEERTVTEVDGRKISLSNLDKVLYPEAAFTKAEVIWYYAHIAPVILPHLRDRPATFVRFPDGVEGQSFFEKHVKKTAPEWVRTVKVPRSSKTGEAAYIEQVMVSDAPTLVWAANLAALEVHVPLWRSAKSGTYGKFDQMVFDLDPGAPADIVACCTVAQWIRQELGAMGLEAYPKTSGSKGLQLYVPLAPTRPWERVHEDAKRLAQLVERDHPAEVVSRMRRDLRGGKVLIDWSQNHAAKTTVAPYSLRARPHPTVSTPVTWDEVAACEASGDPTQLSFVATEVLERVERDGDLFEPLIGARPPARKRKKS